MSAPVHGCAGLDVVLRGQVVTVRSQGVGVNRWATAKLANLCDHSAKRVDEVPRVRVPRNRALAAHDGTQAALQGVKRLKRCVETVRLSVSHVRTLSAVVA